MANDQGKWSLGAALQQDWTTGQILKAAREHQSYSIEYVCDQLHFRPEVVTALENDDYTNLPQATYVKGYIRSYAKLLGVDATLLREKLDQKLACEVPSVAQPRKKKKAASDALLYWSTAVVLLVLAGLFTVWWLYPASDNESNFTDYELNDVLSTAPDATEPEVAGLDSEQVLEATEPQDAPTPEQATEQVNTDEVAQVRDVEDSPARVTAVVATDPQETAEGDAVMQTSDAPPAIQTAQDRLIVQYLEESWTVITDARDRKLLHGLYKSGAVRTISGEAPFTVFLGNSPGVVISINGKKFDQSRFTRSNNTARFELTDSNS